MDEKDEATFEGWAILELMGHRKLGGYVREQNVAGAGFIRIDVPNPKVPLDHADLSANTAEFTATQFYAPGAVYCITPCAEDVARRFAAGCQPAPVTRWELPEPRRATNGASAGEVETPPDEAQNQEDLPY